MASLLQARPGVFDLEQKLCFSLKRKLEFMTLVSSADLVSMYDAVRGAVLSDHIKTDLFATLDAMAAHGMETGGALKVVNGAQDCKTFQKYLTATELTSLQHCSMWEGCSILASRMKQLGIKGMKEGLKRLGCGILVWYDRQRTQQLPKPDLVYSLSQHLTQALATSATETPEGASSLAKYPDDPCGLGSVHFAASYPTEKPACQELPGLAALLNPKVVPVRNSSSSVLANKDSWTGLTSLQFDTIKIYGDTSISPLNLACFLILHITKDFHQHPKPHVEATGCSSSSGMAETLLLKVLDKFSALGNQVLNQQHQEPHIRFFESAGKKLGETPLVSVPTPQTSPLSLPAPHGDLTVASVAPGNANDSKSLEEFEKENMKMLLDREKEKKAANKPTPKAGAKARGQAKTKILKRPAASSKGPTKGPAREAASVANTLEKRGCAKCRADGCSKCRDPNFKAEV